MPEGWSFKEGGGGGGGSNDNVYVFNRGEHPMMVFDHEGNFLRSWGEGQYPRAHGVHMAPDDTMFLMGYSFNLDGSMMYCTFAVIFISQAYNIPLSIPQQVTM